MGETAWRGLASGPASVECRAARAARAAGRLGAGRPGGLAARLINIYGRPRPGGREGEALPPRPVMRRVALIRQGEGVRHGPGLPRAGHVARPWKDSRSAGPAAEAASLRLLWPGCWGPRCRPTHGPWVGTGRGHRPNRHCAAVSRPTASKKAGPTCPAQPRVATQASPMARPGPARSARVATHCGAGRPRWPPRPAQPRSRPQRGAHPGTPSRPGKENSRFEWVKLEVGVTLLLILLPAVGATGRGGERGSTRNPLHFDTSATAAPPAGAVTAPRPAPPGLPTYSLRARRSTSQS